jgi:MEDS: MEthanogen/methylotroph, DcmR Sensory domain
VKGTIIEPKVSDIPNNLVSRLLKLKLGTHYLILYPNIESVRKIYAQYIRVLLEENRVAILFFPYYDTTDKVRQELMLKGIDVKKYEHDNSLTLVDFAKVIDNPYLGIPAAFGLKEFVSKIKSFHSKKTLIVITDMSLYNHLGDIDDLLKYESFGHHGSEALNWKQICLYHKLDFNLMFTSKQQQKIFDYHKDKIIKI